MIPHYQHGRQPFNQKGFTLGEIAFTFLLMSILITSVVVMASGVIKKAKAYRVINEMNAMAESCRQYYSANSAWPANLNTLYPKYLKTNNLINIFGNYYLMNTTNKTVSILTDIPQGLIQTNTLGSQLIITNNGVVDTLTLTKLPPDEGINTLKYEKKYLYNQ